MEGMLRLAWFTSTEPPLVPVELLWSEAAELICYVSSAFFILIFLCQSICFDWETNVFHLKTAMSSAASFISHVDPWSALPSSAVGHEKQFNQPFRDTVYVLDWSTTSFPIPCCTVFILAFNSWPNWPFWTSFSLWSYQKRLFAKVAYNVLMQLENLVLSWWFIDDLSTWTMLPPAHRFLLIGANIAFLFVFLALYVLYIIHVHI